MSNKTSVRPNGLFVGGSQIFNSIKSILKQLGGTVDR